jgi:hypothetical protein
LFEVPKGYQKMPGMDEYYRGMMKGKSDDETAGPPQRRRK